MRKGHTWMIPERLGAALLLTLAGCTGSLKVPVNEYSHVSVEATPFGGSEFMVSYHLYDELPYLAYNNSWKGKIKIDGLGTFYDTESIGSPAAKRLERGWESLWEDGRPGWATIERMITDTDFYGGTERKPKAPKLKSEALEAQQRTDLLPLAELPLFPFSTPPKW
jgi:hypothetical protein